MELKFLRHSSKLMPARKAPPSEQYPETGNTGARSGQLPARAEFWGRSGFEWLSSLPILFFLVLTLVVGTGEMVHGQLLRAGEAIFGDASENIPYFMLRSTPEKPSCSAAPNIEEELRKYAAPKSSDDDIDALFSGRDADVSELRKSLEQAARDCADKHNLYTRLLKHQTPWVKAFTGIEISFFTLFHLGTENRPLILLLIVSVAAVTTTVSHHHIAIRSARYTKDHRIQAASQAFAAGLLLYSCIRYYLILESSSAAVQQPILHAIWITLAASLLLVNGWRTMVPPRSPHGEGNWAGALATVPLYAVMGAISGVYFLLNGHASGLAIYVNQLMELPSVFLNLALFIWAGMLLKQSRVMDLFMDVLRPWRLSPQLLTYIVLLAAALPTAYTGASGIFVIAAGGIIYHEVRASGGSRPFALAATAMSGSLGVVLRPCLLVVLIAALNKQVTTHILYHWGMWVFLLTSTLFFLVSQALRTQRASIETFSVAIPGMLRALVPTLPYIGLTLTLLTFYEYGLNTRLNEISAPTIMPVILLMWLILDKFAARERDMPAPDHASHRQPTVETSIRYATNETTGHIGALLSLMMLSMAMGGVIERSDVMGHFPRVFESHWAAMAFLVVTKVLLGTIMDPFGAVVLVSGTLAPIAFANDIDPSHFWMMVLVAFELGYLLPPVGLNQLLTRQVLGESEIDQADLEVKSRPFFWRHERWILPMIVMTLALLIVAFGPLAVQDFSALAFIRDWFAPSLP